MTPPAAGRRLVFVSGPPGAGKTTLARPLAAELGFALLAKDRIKEALHDALGLDPDLAWSRRLGAATMELLWALAADSPAVVLEANFWPDDPRHGERVRALGARTVEVYCSCPLEECRRRYAARAASRHPVHVLDRDPGLAAGAAISGGMAVPTVPVPTVPVPTGPVPTGPVPTERVPTVPVPALPQPAMPVPAERVPAEPGPADGPTADTFIRSARPLRLGPVVTVDTARPVDIAALAAAVQRLLAA